MQITTLTLEPATDAGATAGFGIPLVIATYRMD